MTLDVETPYGTYAAEFVKDTASGFYTAWLKEVPASMAQGETIYECIPELRKLLEIIYGVEADVCTQNLIEECFG